MRVKKTKEEIRQSLIAAHARRREARKQFELDMRTREWESLTEEEKAVRQQAATVMARLTATFKQARLVRKAAAIEVERILHERTALAEEYRPLYAKMVELEQARKK